MPEQEPRLIASYETPYHMAWEVHRHGDDQHSVYTVTLFDIDSGNRIPFKRFPPGFKGDPVLAACELALHQAEMELR